MKYLSKCVCTLVLGLAAGSAWATPIVIGDVNVGGLDPLVAQTNNLNGLGQCGNGSSPAVEVCWVNKALQPSGVSYTLDDFSKEEDVSYAVVNGSIIVFELASPAQHFLIKNSTWWALFTNVASTNWAVIDTTQLNSGFRLPTSPFVISHIGLMGEVPPTTVPAPGMLGLLGAGLLALALVRRRVALAS